jgi:Copper binding periplasmic protein CusF
MKPMLITALVAALSVACSKQTPKETTYQMTGTIVSRDVAKNTVNLDNKAVPRKMEAMKMDYEVRGAKVSALPADGSVVVVTVHDETGTPYVTDVHRQTTP